MEGKLVAVPENVANINAMYLKARHILLVCPDVFVTWGSYRRLTECNSHVDS